MASSNPITERLLAYQKDPVRYVREVFGAEPQVSSFRDSGMDIDGVMHASVSAPNGFNIFASDIAEGMEMVQDECLRHGITSVANSLTPSKAIRAYQDMRRDGRWRMRMGIIASGRDEPP